MKKTLFLAVLAGATLASCVKNEPVTKGDGSPEPITFDAPVVSIPTKATEIVSNYPKDADFAVYALKTDNQIVATNTPAITGESSTYMNNVKCVANNATAPDYWQPADRTYYWPKTGYLTFGAYAPAQTVTTAKEVEWDAVTGFKFNNYTVKTKPAEQIDLLYSNSAYDKKAKDMLGAADKNPYQGITLKFNHALSSIVFMAKAEGTVGEDKISITKIEVKNVYQQGNFVQNQYQNGTTGTAAWTTTGALTNYVVFEGDLALTTDEAPVNGELDSDNADGKRKSDLIVIPQKLAGGADGRGEGTADATVEISYKITHANGDVTTETVPFKLAVADQNTDGKLESAWEIGKRYIYHISIGLQQIYFNPTVTNWEDIEGAWVVE